MLEDAFVFAEGLECAAQVEPKVDPLLERVLGLGKATERGQCLLQARGRFAVGAPRGRFFAGLEQESDGALP